MGKQNGNGKQPRVEQIQIVVNIESGEMQMNHPADPLLSLEILANAQKLLLTKLAQARAAASKSAVRIAPAGALPPDRPGLRPI